MTLTGRPGKVVTPEPESGLEAGAVTGAGPATRSRSWQRSVPARLRLRQLNKSVCRPQTPDHYTTSAVTSVHKLE